MSAEAERLSIKNMTYVRNFIGFNSNVVFDKKTAIYAPNGSGKTNLSRLLQYVKDTNLDLDELKSHEAEYRDNLRFKILIGNHEINETNFSSEVEAELLSRVQVFNSDFIDQNINMPNFSDHDVSGEIKVELGDAEGKLKEAEKRKSDLIEGRKSSHEALVKIKESTKSRLINEEKKYTKSDFSIWNELEITKIITDDFKLNDQYVNYLKEEEQIKRYDTCETDFINVKSVSRDDSLVFNQSRVNLIELDEIVEILATPTTLPKIDTQTENNLKFLHGWLHDNIAHNKSADDIIKSAIDLSEDESRNKCILCKRALDNDTKKLFGSYKEYYAGEKAKYESKLKSWIRELGVTKDSLDELNNSLEDKVSQFCQLFNIENTWTDIDTTDEEAEIQNIINQLNSKIEDPASPIGIDAGIKKSIGDINRRIDLNRKLCEKINTKIKNTQNRATELRVLIGQKYLYELVVNHENDINKLTSFNKKISEADNDIRELRKSLPSKDVRSSVKKLFNLFLHKRVGIDKYEVDIIDDRIVLKLLDSNISENTKRISEGEKVMIGLCYFFASCIITLNEFDKFKKSIFIIDDPVSSTSYGNFFGISSLINHFEEDIRKIIWPNEASSINIQKIILTHNTQFFNLVQAHIFKNKQSINF